MRFEHSWRRKASTAHRRSASVAVLVLAATLVWPLAACTRRTPRSVGAFCSTLADQKHQFLTNYATSSRDPLQSMVTGLASIGEIPVIFERLDRVAPPDIEPDIAAVRDSFKQQIASISGIASNPLGGLATAFVSSLVAAGPFQRVSDYASKNCPGQSHP